MSFVATRAILGQRLLASFGPRAMVSRFLTSPPNHEHVIVALGGNALLRRGQELTVENQRENIRQGMDSLKSILSTFGGVTLVHGNGPQSGLLVLESAAYEKSTGLKQMPLDVIDAKTEGMIGYGLEQELARNIVPGRGMATLLSQVIVDRNDPAFQNPTKVMRLFFLDGLLAAYVRDRLLTSSRLSLAHSISALS